MRYRFKTEEEFIKEFGERWRSRVNFNNSGYMDYLLGTSLPPELRGRTCFSIYDPSQERRWCISSPMLILEDYICTISNNKLNFESRSKYA